MQNIKSFDQKQKQVFIRFLYFQRMNQSPSLQDIVTEFMSNAEMEQLSQNDRKLILSQLKKIYSQQMSKVASELSKRNQVKNNKNHIEQKQELQIKSIHQNSIKKMEQHNKKREKAFIKKINHFKLLDQNWKFKLKEIQRKKKEETRHSIQKAAQYRKQAQTFWSQNRKNNKSISLADYSTPVIQNQNYFSIKAEVRGTSNKLIKPQSQQFYQNKRKTQSKNELSNVTKTLLPNIQRKSYFLTKQPNQDSNQNSGEDHIKMHQSLHRIVNDKTIQDHIEKSKHLNTEKEEFALQKALEKMKMIELKRKKCKQDRQKSIKQAKIKRQLRQQNITHAERNRLSKQQNQPSKHYKQKNNDQKSIESIENILSQSRSRKQGHISLSESIVKHQKAKQQIEEQKFSQRGELLIANIIKQKKGKMIRMVKETINKLKHQALKDA